MLLRLHLVCLISAGVGEGFLARISRFGPLGPAKMGKIQISGSPIKEAPDFCAIDPLRGGLWLSPSQRGPSIPIFRPLSSRDGICVSPASPYSSTTSPDIPKRPLPVVPDPLGDEAWPPISMPGPEDVDVMTRELSGAVSSSRRLYDIVFGGASIAQCTLVILPRLGPSTSLLSMGGGALVLGGIALSAASWWHKQATHWKSLQFMEGNTTLTGTVTVLGSIGYEEPSSATIHPSSNSTVAAVIGQSQSAPRYTLTFLLHAVWTLV